MKERRVKVVVFTGASPFGGHAGLIFTIGEDFILLPKLLYSRVKELKDCCKFFVPRRANGGCGEEILLRVYFGVLCFGNGRHDLGTGASATTTAGECGGQMDFVLQ